MIALPRVHHHRIDVDGVEVFYRESVPDYEPGARAYLTDLPEAELHLFDTGHFALEDHLPQIASLIAAYLDRLPA